MTLDRAESIKWARELLATDKPVYVMDSESTGLSPDAEIIQLAMVDLSGEPLINTLVKCRNPDKMLKKGRNNTCASDIHGIHPEDIVLAPTWDDLREQTNNFVWMKGCRLVIYNASYDWPIFQRDCGLGGFNVPKPFSVECAMRKYAEFVGDWNDHWHNYRFQKLPQSDGVQQHTAIGDCISTLAVIKEMAATSSQEISDG